MVLIPPSGAGLVLTLQLCTINARPTSLVLPSSVSLYLPNTTLGIGQLISNATMNASHAKYDYEIPNTDIILKINRHPDLPMTQAAITTCLESVIEIAKARSPVLSIPSVWWYYEPSGGARFGIVPPMYSPDLRWGDVVDIAGGLTDYVNEENVREELSFFVENEDGGALGSGVIQNPEPVTNSQLREGNGVIATS